MIKGEVKPKAFTSCSLRGAESNGLGPRKLRCSLPPLFPLELAHFHRNWVTAPYYMGVCMQNVTKSTISFFKKARMTAIGPYVFWTPSQLVLVRKGCDAAFGPYPNRTWLNKRSRAPAYTSHLAAVPAGCN